MIKNTNNDRCLNSLLFMSKLFCIFLFLFIQNFRAQIFISKGGSVYGENEVSFSHPDSLALNYPKSKIYISSNVKIFNIEALTNYEIVETIISEKKKIEPKKQTVINIAKTQSEKKIQQKLASKKENLSFYKHTFSHSKSEVYFSFVGNFSKVTIPISQTYAKQIMHSENYMASLSFRGTKLASKYFKRAELITAQNRSAFPVRPPPFFFS